MKKTLAEWITLANQCQFPVMSISKQKLSDLLENEEDIKVDDLLTLTRLDPGISINLLRYAGKKQKREVTTVSHAILLISIPIVIKQIQALPTLEDVIDNNLISKIKRFYFFQYLTGTIAMDWSILRKESENNELFAAGLNRSFAQLFLFLTDTDTANDLHQFRAKNIAEVVEKETALIGCTLDQLSKAIAENWNLPYLIRESYSSHHHNPKVQGIKLADKLVRWLYVHELFNYPEKLIEQVSEYIRSSSENTCTQINKSVIKAIRSTHDRLPRGSILRALMSHPDSIIAQKNTLVVDKKKILSNKLMLLRKSISKLEENSACNAYVEAMFHYFGPSKLAILLYDTEQNTLGNAVTANNSESSLLKKVMISLEINRLFQQLTKKESLLLIDENNKKKYIPHMPPGLLSVTHNGIIILHSIFINKQLYGCIVMQKNEKNTITQPQERKIYQTIYKELKNTLELLQNSNHSKVA